MKFNFFKISTFIAILFLVISCETPTKFSNEALQEKLVTLDNKETTLEAVLNNYRGNKVLIDFWASWCKDCIVRLPDLKKLQKKYPNIIYLFLSVDKDQGSWKSGIRKYKIEGEHYNLPKGMNTGDLADFVNINWIPRYMVIDEDGNISLFKATKITDNNIEEALK